MTATGTSPSTGRPAASRCADVARRHVEARDREPLVPPPAPRRLGVRVTGPLDRRRPSRGRGSRRGARHVAMLATASAPSSKKNSRPGAASASSVSAVTDGPGRSTSTAARLDPVDARRRPPRQAPAGRRADATTWPRFCHGSPATTSRTRSRCSAQRASPAATRCPTCTGSNVPPSTPMRSPTADSLGAVVSRCYTPHRNVAVTDGAHRVTGRGHVVGPGARARAGVAPRPPRGARSRRVAGRRGRRRHRRHRRPRARRPRRGGRVRGRARRRSTWSSCWSARSRRSTATSVEEVRVVGVVPRSPTRRAGVRRRALRRRRSPADATPAARGAACAGSSSPTGRRCSPPARSPRSDGTGAPTTSCSPRWPRGRPRRRWSPTGTTGPDDLAVARLDAHDATLLVGREGTRVPPPGAGAAAGVGACRRPGVDPAGGAGQPSATVVTKRSSWRRLRHSYTPSQYGAYSEMIESPVSQ